ncbi:hypothetical protein GALL_314240 [mine drainage metagenome]|uniref:Type IV pilus assembly protein PilW n=1 Tax=mine drainage metagenome TaxID=410659 RepID=A0A1J5R402_9ZZZZ
MEGMRKIEYQRGLTLVEMMIAMAIGLILLLALGGMLSGSLRHFKVQDEFSRMQENGQFALNAIGYDIRMAGFFGKLGVVNVAIIDLNQDGIPDPDPIAASTGDDCGAGWATDFQHPVFGYSGLVAAGANAALPCIDPANFLAGSPILVLRGAGGQEVTAPLNNVLYLQSTAAAGIVFNGSDYPLVMANPIHPPWLAKLDGSTPASIFPYQPRAYYLRPCSRPSGAAASATSDPRCRAGDDGGQAIPTLVRQELDGLAMVEQPVAEGIERFSVLYGLDDVNMANRDGYVNTYVAAPLASDFDRVVAIRVAVLARSLTASTGHDDSGKTYDMGDGSAPFACTAGVNCGYHRHVFSQTFQVRNLSQRLQQ